MVASSEDAGRCRVAEEAEEATFVPSAAFVVYIHFLQRRYNQSNLFAEYVFSYSEMPPVAVNPNAQHIVIDGKEYVFNSCLCGLNTEEFIRLNE